MKPPLFIQIICVALLVQMAGLGPAEAQTPRRSSGAGSLLDRALPAAPRKDIPEPPAAPESAASAEDGDPKPLGVNLLGLHLISKPTKRLPKDMRMVMVVDPALHLPPGLADSLQHEYLGQPLSMALLNRLVKRINKAYQATDFPLVDSYLPEQDITSGHVQVMVREAVLGAVRVEGARHSNPDYMIRQVRLQPGARIDTSVVGKDAAWLNENPIRTVNIVYERGAKEGTSDLILKTTEVNPFQAYAGYANSGLVATGLNEVTAGFNWYQMLGSEQSLSYQFSANQELDALKSHALVWGIPFPWRHRLQLIGVHADNAVQTGPPGTTLGITGRSRQFTAAYSIPLHSAWSRVRPKLTFAADYKSTTSDVLFGGQSLASSDAEVMQFRGGFDVVVSDPLGYTRFAASAVYSPGNLLSRNTYEAFDQLRAGSQVEYWYAVAELERLIRLPKECSIALFVAGQYSNDRLLPTEQTLAGGYRTVRGYDESSARGDSGIRGSIEFNFPVMHLAGWTGKEDTLNTFLFYDAAYLTSVGDLASEPDQKLQSAGLGLRYNLDDHFDLRLAYGWTFNHEGIQNVRDGRLHFGMNVRY